MVEQLGAQASTLESFGADIAAAEKRANEHFGIEESESEDEESDDDSGDGDESEDVEEGVHDDSGSENAHDESEGSDGESEEEEDDHDEEDNERAEKATKKTKAKSVKADGEPGEAGRDEPSDDDVSILRAQAKKLGFELDKGQKTVSIPERTAFRAKMARDRGKLDQQVHAAQAQLQERGKRMEQKFSKSLELEAAIEAQDYDKVGRLMGSKDYRDMNMKWLRLSESPDYKKNQAMEAKIAAMEKREAEGRAEMGRAAQARQKQADSESWDEEVRGYLSNDNNPIVAALSNEPDFIEYVNGFLRGANGDMSVEEARDLAITELRKEQSRLNKYFGAPGGSTPSDRDNVETLVNGASVEKKSKKRAKRSASKSISHKEATDASNKSPTSGLSDEKYFAYWEKKARQAKD